MREVATTEPIWSTARLINEFLHECLMQQNVLNERHELAWVTCMAKTRKKERCIIMTNYADGNEEISFPTCPLSFKILLTRITLSDIGLSKNLIYLIIWKIDSCKTFCPTPDSRKSLCNRGWVIFHHGNFRGKCTAPIRILTIFPNICRPFKG